MVFATRSARPELSIPFAMPKEDAIYSSTCQSTALNALLSSIIPGEKVDIIFYRKGTKNSTTIKSEEISFSSIEKYIKNVLGVEVDDIDKKKIAKYNLFTSSGVVITSVKKRGLFSRYGLKEGDVVKRYGSKNIEDMDDFRKAVINSYGEPSIIIYIQRGRDIYYGAIGE